MANKHTHTHTHIKMVAWESNLRLERLRKSRFMILIVLHLLQLSSLPRREDFHPLSNPPCVPVKSTAVFLGQVITPSASLL